MQYTIKVWLFTVILSPFLLVLTLGVFINSAQLGEIVASWPMVFFMILYGLVLSIPAMALFWLVQRKFIKVFTENKTKFILSIYSLLSVWITFFVVDQEFAKRGIQQLFWVVVYSLTLVLGTWFFAFPISTDKEEITGQNSQVLTK